MKKRFRHTFTFWLLRPFIRMFLWMKYRVKPTRFKKKAHFDGPSLIVANHALELDPFIIATSFKEPIYYVASDMIFSIPFWSFWIRYLVSPIPKTKYRSDYETIRDIKRIVKSGGSVCVFPEGNSTWHGKTMPMHPSIAKLAKLLRIPVIIYRIENGYLTKPRWGATVRRGAMRAYVHDVWSVDKVQSMSVTTLHEKLTEALDVDIRKTIIKPHYSKRSAEDIESAYFWCPSCHSFATIYSEGEQVRCKTCKLEARYLSDGSITANDDAMPNDTGSWYEQQKAALKHVIATIDQDTVLFRDEHEMVYEVERAYKKTLLGSATIQLSNQLFRVAFDYGEGYSWDVETLDISVQQKHKLIVYHRPSETTLYCINDKKRNAIKYVLGVEALKERGGLNDGL